jgi:putative transposase
VSAVAELAPAVGTQAACRALEVSRATVYRRRQPPPASAPRPRPPRALTIPERHGVLEALHAPRFVDLAPAEVYATLLDEGHYLCSLRTMYRVLASAAEGRPRRNQLRHVAPIPELLATRPNEVWSWDITKLLGPVKWTFYYLYVILDSCGAPGYVESRPEAQASVGFRGLRLHITGVASQRLKPRED